MVKLVLLGGPGAGKGTQAAKLKEYYGITHISTGEILREARAAGTDLGKKAGEYMDAGKLLPDDIILGIIEERLASPALRDGFLFDGFPRTIPQAGGLDAMLAKSNRKLDVVLSIESPDELIITRLLRRAEIEGRADDNRATIEHRLKVYYEQTEPLKGYYRGQGILKEVDGIGTVDEVFERVKVLLGS